jgi:thiamine-monophosphate kinase
MTLSALGEDATVAALTHRLPTGPQVRVGPGDDCAVLGRPKDDVWRLLKTDAVVEGVHFLAEENPARVGWKALCRAVSDIAAMGGLPGEALVTVAVPETKSLAWLESLYEGLRKAARKFKIAIVGGETSRSPGAVFINIALAGAVERACCVRRSGGKPGDLLFVTGRLGGSLAGHHLDFVPRLKEARWLVEHFRLHAMMDLSDGLGSDLPRLATASGCGYIVEDERLPCTPGCGIHEAMTDGEDYELLFAVSPREAAVLEPAWKAQFPKLPLTAIGKLTAPSAQKTPLRGHDHFRQSR